MSAAALTALLTLIGEALAAVPSFVQDIENLIHPPTPAPAPVPIEPTIAAEMAAAEAALLAKKSA
jgi:hypothetical protein